MQIRIFFANLIELLYRIYVYRLVIYYHYHVLASIDSREYQLAGLKKYFLMVRTVVFC